ncbi:hypothetical protein C8A03DRAFT_19908 [Achaetomium macrosporum]|uniref:Uncharacterized protein n=1 Tax=Achaetomium macrosporum TaxID=79813 RepID=A0AAN7H9H6_9PEZI|nr:hypothetical protein C8A03DRAFT_19908 [Achaetomium macrosporum]
MALSDPPVPYDSHQNAAPAPSADALPSYESVVGSSATATPSPGEATGDAKESGHFPKQQQDAPTTKFSPYTKYGEGWGTLMLSMVPEPSVPVQRTEARTTPWVATLIVKCEDMPRLMREGFFWLAENVVPEHGFLSDSLTRAWTAGGYRHFRVWILAKTCSPDETPRWVARLEVVAASIEPLSKFRVQDLSRENVLRANAWDTKKRCVYNYHCCDPDLNYNCIYDDKPLDGWWPWPKERDHQRHAKEAHGANMASQSHSDGGKSIMSDETTFFAAKEHGRRRGRERDWCACL